MSDLRQFTSDTLPEKYRPCVGIFLINRQGRVFAGRRNDGESDDMIPGLIEKPWQLPQGGIDPGEAPAAAVLRELYEEVGTRNVTILGESRYWQCYDVPTEIATRKWSGKYRGQGQKWFALRFDGSDDEINIATPHPEFDAWKWVNIEEICDLVVTFKREVYARVVDEFRQYAAALQQSTRV